MQVFMSLFTDRSKAVVLMTDVDSVACFVVRVSVMFGFGCLVATFWEIVVR